MYGYSYCEQLLRAKLWENCKLRGTDNVQGQVYTRAYCLNQIVVIVVISLPVWVSPTNVKILLKLKNRKRSIKIPPSEMKILNRTLYSKPSLNS